VIKAGCVAQGVKKWGKPGVGWIDDIAHLAPATTAPDKIFKNRQVLKMKLWVRGWFKLYV